MNPQKLKKLGWAPKKGDKMMAVYRLYVHGRTELRKVTLGLTYSYDGSGTLVVSRNGETLLTEVGVEPGEMYALCYENGACRLVHMRLSRYPDRLLMFLLSFEHRNQGSSREEYEKILTRRREETKRLGEWQEHTVEGKGYAFTVFAFDYDHIPNIRAAAYVEPGLRLTKSMVVRVMQEIYGGVRFPKRYVYDKILRPRFGFTDDDILALEEWQDENNKKLFKKILWY